MSEPGGAFLDRLEADLLRFYRLSLWDWLRMPGGSSTGLVMALPPDAMTHADVGGRTLPVLLTARHIEVTHELIRVVLAALGVKRRRLPPPLRLLELPDEAQPDIRSPDPRAWSMALGARIVKVEQ